MSRRILAMAGAVVALMVAGCAHLTEAPARIVGTVSTGHHARPAPVPPPDTYLAEGQDVSGTTAQRPSCAAGCPLNDLGTVVLYNMRWRVWDSSAATGTGTETIQSCDDICSGLPQYQAKVTVTFSRPVEDCAVGQAYWTRAVFGYPQGLGDAPAPPDPWDFTTLAASARSTCHH
jgi:hypothetical protein